MSVWAAGRAPQEGQQQHVHTRWARPEAAVASTAACSLPHNNSSMAGCQVHQHVACPPAACLPVPLSDTGTGKTLLARAVANRTDACFIRVIGSELVQKYVGEVSVSRQAG